MLRIPDTFSRVLADEDIDIGRKLDKGNDLLMDIKRDTSALPDMKMGIDNMNAKFDSLNAKFDSFIIVQGEHNKRLEKILEKLAER